MIRRLLPGVLACALFSGAAFARVTVNSQTAIFINEREPGPIQLAAKDLASDLQKVFGHPVRIVHEPSKATPVTLWIAFDHDLPKAVTRPAGWEQFRIQAAANPWPGSPTRQAIVLTGSGVRGTIYAIYQFSQQFLGVDPLYWWTDRPPARRQAVAVPDGYSETQGPLFRHRGLFINDEDLLTGWRSGIPDGADISLETWNRIFEAILRLKGDMVIPGTWIFPYEPQIKAAEERGLIVTQHHVNVLGLDTYRWPEDKPYSFINAPAIFEAALKRSVEEYPKGAEIIWSVGYRGHNDYPFWLADKNAPTTAAGRAKVIQDAIGKEIEIVSELHPHPEIVLNAWAEAAPFIRQGLLKVPQGVTLVWPDDGHGTIQDRGEIKAGEGEYYHTAMIDWRSNHFSELVPLERIRRELGRAARAGATDYLIVNTSNLRPVVMTSRATMELAWNPKAWMAESPDEASVYLHNWSREEFGDKAVEAAVKYYQAYFKAPAKYGQADDALMGDQFYEIFSRFLLVQLSKGNTHAPFHGFGMPESPSVVDFAAKLASACEAAVPRWENVTQLAEAAEKLVPAGRQQFFQANVLTQARINQHGNLMLFDIAKAVQTEDAAARVPLIRAALNEGLAIQKSLAAADYGKWKGFYTDGDWLLDVPLTLNLERAYIRQLEGHGMDENLMIRAQDGGFAYYMITAYQGTQKVQF